MLQSERLRYIQEQATRYISRNKCTDSSTRTLVVQSKASGLATPVSVPVVGIPAAYAPIVPVAVPGTVASSVRCGVAAGDRNRDSVGILQSKQACALASDVQGGVITLPVPCINMNAPPFTQQNMVNPYIAPCTPGNNVYFPPPISNGPGCDYTRITTPS